MGSKVRRGIRHVFSAARQESEIVPSMFFPNAKNGAAFHFQLKEMMGCLQCRDDEFVLRVLSCGFSDAPFFCVLDLAQLLSDKWADFWSGR